MPSLSRIFLREAEPSHRLSVMVDTISSESATLVSFDPWRVVMDTAEQSNEGLSRSLQWLCLFSRSGVIIPDEKFTHFASILAERDCQLSESILLVKAVLASAWLQSLGRQHLQTVISVLHSRFAVHIADSLKRNSESELMSVL